MWKLAAEGVFSRASRSAIRKQQALGIPVTFKRGKKIIRKHADGREEILDVLKDPKPGNSAVAKGMKAP